jgi:hypothetical protein
MAVIETSGQPANLILDLASLLGNMSLGGVDSSLSIGMEKIELAFKATEGRNSRKGANGATTCSQGTALSSTASSLGVRPNYDRAEPPVPGQDEDIPYGPRPFVQAHPASLNLSLSPALAIFT